MKKINQQAIEKIAKEISKLETLSTKDMIDDIVHTSSCEDSRILSIRVKDIDYEIWKSSKKDEKFEVIKIVPFGLKTSERDSHTRMTKEDIFKNIIFKAFYSEDECKKISKKLTE